ncbi:hypothetical protein BY458DRAFT_516925, partial [Sporodiniella umbellata]
MVFADNFELIFELPEHWPNVGITKVLLHAAQILLSTLLFFLVLPTMVIGKRYEGPDQASAQFVLALTLISLPIALLLALCPWARFQSCSRLYRFFLRPRTTLIFTCFFSFAWCMALISSALHANQCRLDPKHKEAAYASQWFQHCQLSTAIAIFSFLLFLLWFLTVLISVLLFWYDKKLNYERSSVYKEKTTCS